MIKGGTDSAKLLAKVRGDTPGALGKVHFNNAGAALPVSQVLDAQVSYLTTEAQNGGYEVAASMAKELQRPYEALAKMLNCHPRNIAIMQSATSAWSQVFFGLPFQEGDRVLTSVAEYASNYIAFLQVAKRNGIKIEVIPEDEEGEIDLEALEGMLSSGSRKPALIAINHIPTNSGRVYDAAGVGRLAKRHGVPYLLDACQSAGQMPLDVTHLGCDWLSATARKYLRGPRGMGFLYASDEAMERFEPGVLDLHGAQWTSAESYEMYPWAVRYEQYEKSFAAQVGFGVAVDYALEVGMDWIWERIQLLAGRLRAQLGDVEGVTVRDKGRTLCGIVTFSKEGVEPEAIKAHLAARDINVHLTKITSTRTDFEQNGLPSALVRASLSYYNTEEEIEVFMDAIRSL